MSVTAPKENQRGALLLTGKPSPALYQLAKKLSTKWDMVFVDPSVLLESIVKMTASSEIGVYNEIKDLLLLGDHVPNGLLASALKHFLQSDSVLFKGVIIYGFFDLCKDQDDIDSFISKVWEPSLDLWRLENVQYLSIHVNYDDEDVINARGPNFLFDPETGLYYSKDDIEFSRIYHAAKKAANEDEDSNEGGSEETAAEIEDAKDMEVDKGDADEIAGDGAGKENNGEDNEEPGSNENEANGTAGEGAGGETNGEENTGNEEASESPEEIARRKKREDKKRLIAPEVLGRLVVRLEDIENRIRVDLDRLNILQPRLDSFFHAMPELYHYSLDGAQGLDELEKTVLEIFSRLLLEVTNARPKPLTSLPTDDAPSMFQGMNPEDILARLLTVEEEDEAFGKPRRRLSQFNRFCPVSYHERKDGAAKVVVEGSHDYSVTFKHFVYYTANRASLEKFMAYPYRYLRSDPVQKQMRLVLVGPPGSGKSLQAKFLASKRNLLYLGPESISTDPSLCQKVVDNGGVLGFDVIVDWIASTLTEKLSGYDGWVVDGLVENKSHFDILIAKGIKPDLVVVFRYESIEDGRARVNNHLVYNMSSHQAEAKPSYSPFGTGPEQLRSDKSIITRDNNENIISIAEDAVLGTLIEEFEKTHVEIGQLLQVENIPLLSYSSKTFAPKIYHEIVSRLDPFYPKALSTILPDENAFDNPNLSFGESKHFCPVTLKTRGVLRQADSMFAALYKAKCYIFPNKENMDLFLDAPDYYTNYGSDFPNTLALPPRILVVGPSQCGKTSLGNDIAAHYGHGIEVLNFAAVAEAWTKSNNHHKAAVQAYLKDSESNPLPDDTFQQLLDHIFYDHKNGFFLEGFPKTRKEAELMEQFGFYPDAVIHYVMDNGLYIRKNLKRALHDVKTRTIKNEEDGKIVPANIENPEEVARNELAEAYEKEAERTEEIVELFKTSMKVTSVPLNGQRCLRFNLSQAKRALYPFLEARKSLFLHTVPISRKKAKELLTSGFALHSQYGHYCPVELKKHAAYFESFRAAKPVICGERIYYLLTGKNVKEFLKNPSFFSPENSTRDQRVKSTPGIIVIGAPKAGKTSLARKLCATLGVQYLNISEVLRIVLERKGVSNLKQQILDGLNDGNIINAEICVKALKSVIQSNAVVTKGWVLDDFPLSENEIDLLEDHNITPKIVFDMSVNEAEQIERLYEDQAAYKNILIQNLQQELNAKKTAPTHATPAYQMMDYEVEENLKARIANYSGGLDKSLSKVYNDKRGVLIALDGNSSKWMLSHVTSAVCDNIISRHQEFLVVISSNKPFPIERCGLHRDYVEKHFGKFGTYCPVSFVDNNDLVNMNTSYLTSLIVFYQGEFFKVKDENSLAKLLADPVRYIVKSEKLPEFLPQPLSYGSFDEIKFPASVSLQGYCPVSFRMGNQVYESIVRGLPHLCAEYRGEIYAMMNEANHDRFMRQPWQYVGQTLPRKLPPPAVAIDIKSLPIMGYLEQNVAISVQKALVAVGHARPKLADHDISESAVRYLALYFKANNLRLKPHVRSAYQKRLESLVSASQDLRLISGSFSIGSYVPFKILNEPLKKAFGHVYEINSDLPSPRKLTGK